MEVLFSSISQLYLFAYLAPPVVAGLFYAMHHANYSWGRGHFFCLFLAVPIAMMAAFILYTSLYSIDQSSLMLLSLQ